MLSSSLAQNFVSLFRFIVTFAVFRWLRRFVTFSLDKICCTLLLRGTVNILLDIIKSDQYNIVGNCPRASSPRNWLKPTTPIWYVISLGFEEKSRRALPCINQPDYKEVVLNVFFYVLLISWCRILDMQVAKNCRRISKFSFVQWPWWFLTDRYGLLANFPVFDGRRLY